MEMRDYLDTLVSQIRCKKARGMVEEEVKAHIEDQAEACRMAGMSEEDAVAEAVRQMGDPVEAGVALDRVHRPGMDWKMLLLVGLLSILGLVVQYTINAEVTGGSLILRQVLYTGIGCGVMMLVCWADYSVIGRYPILLWLGFSACILGYSLFGPMVNGVHNYLRPMIYLYVPLYVGLLYRYRGGGYKALLKCFCFFLVSMYISMIGVTIPVCLDVAVICLALTVCALWKNWFRVPIKRTIAALLGASLVISAAFFAWGMYGEFQYYQSMRVKAALNPMAYPDGAGYQYSMVRKILESSAWVGENRVVLEGELYHATQLIPGDSHTDYILTHIMAYYGILAGVAVLLLLAVFLYRIFRITAVQKNRLGQMIGLGCGMIFAVQLWHYVLFNLGFGIFTGINLPFFTFGIWVTVSTYVLAGLLLSIYRYKDVTFV